MIYNIKKTGFLRPPHAGMTRFLPPCLRPCTATRCRPTPYALPFPSRPFGTAASGSAKTKSDLVEIKSDLEKTRSDLVFHKVRPYFPAAGFHGRLAPPRMGAILTRAPYPARYTPCRATRAPDQKPWLANYAHETAWLRIKRKPPHCCAAP